MKPTVLGAAVMLAVAAVVFIAVFGFIYRPDHDLTKQASAVLMTAAGGLLVGATRFFGDGDGAPRP